MILHSSNVCQLSLLLSSYYVHWFLSLHMIYNAPSCTVHFKSELKVCNTRYKLKWIENSSTEAIWIWQYIFFTQRLLIKNHPRYAGRQTVLQFSSICPMYISVIVWHIQYTINHIIFVCLEYSTLILSHPGEVFCEYKPHLKAGSFDVIVNDAGRQVYRLTWD